MIFFCNCEFQTNLGVTFSPPPSRFDLVKKSDSVTDVDVQLVEEVGGVAFDGLKDHSRIGNDSIRPYNISLSLKTIKLLRKEDEHIICKTHILIVVQ